MKKIMLGTSDDWSMSHLSHGPIDPEYYIEDYRMFDAGEPITKPDSESVFLIGRIAANSWRKF